ncbi:PREDICTED: zinc finger protein 346-like [Dufourea novaeangliae]|uniref:zinc finger protein 346-like n=1 Tax=Dufourea novaeangliae TaxID=178035 RepID=UPI000766F2ED|nr:PREDICTED: zinc finger protein 346-like [Dufourea novaeangliae]
MAVSSEDVMNPSLDDPVTKAVVDNIMGNLPTKKPFVRCDDCDLSFTSQTVLDTHLQGARHAKQIRSKNIMASLEETKVAFTKDEETNGLKCNVCNVCLNSIQQLQTHLNGSRHKKKAMRGNKHYMVRKSLSYRFRWSRTMCMDKIIERSVAVLIYCLILFTFACLILLLTFTCHFFSLN